MRERLESAYERLRHRTNPAWEATLLLQGKQMAWQVAAKPPNTDFREVGFKVFSQFDEDGIIQYLVHNIPIDSKTFIEFGVEKYVESNTRFLLLNDHWRGMVLDAKASHIRYIRNDKIYWQYDLQSRCTWITCENINALLQDADFGEDVGILSIDIDGNDFWIWQAITSVRPRILIIEYNSLLGLQPIAIPYKEDFVRTDAHYSNLYYGASLGALHYLAQQKGYMFLGSNIWGHNAFFVRNDVAGKFHATNLRSGYVASKFRESRDRRGRLTYARGLARIRIIEDMPVVDVTTGRTSKLREIWQPVEQQ